MKNNLPLFLDFPKGIQTEINSRYKQLGDDYKPRTEHLNTDKKALFVNKLIFEESPYLLQHAHNPVNWQPWSPESFALAKKQNKSIFLSIGYATCHWCHVMEHESFENIEIAQFINQHFIAIKVDRERRSAVDAYYMTGVQMMTGHGGWPMSNFLTPEGKPFFGGTYYQPQQFLTLLQRVSEVWKTQEKELRSQAIKIDASIKKHLSQSHETQKINPLVNQQVNDYLLTSFDELQGGFTSAPKFPQEPWLLYLLQQNNANTNHALQFTLDEMQQAGIFDQVGGGFHRYATDNAWLIPHFEKMLYNQSQLGEVYTTAALSFNSKTYKRTAVMIFDYVLKEMTSADGVFYSAGDADSDGQEGLFFTWTYAELKNILTADEFIWAQKIYDISKQGNFEGRTILSLGKNISLIAKDSKLSLEEVFTLISKLNTKLYHQRLLRNPPLIDNKIITAWNAQMVYSLAKAGYGLNNDAYQKAAIKSMNYLLETHHDQAGFLVRNSLNGKTSHIKAELEDFAWMVTALIELYDVTNDDKWLTKAHSLIIQVQQSFEDSKNGGFYDNVVEDNIPHTARIKQSEDGAEVSANGQLLIALARYYRRTGDSKIEDLYTRTLAHFSGKIVKNPISHTSMLRAKSIYEGGEDASMVYASKAKVKITSLVESNKVILKFKIDNGWHINANIIKDKSLIPLSVSSKPSLNFIYPQAKTTRMSFSNKELSTFEGEFTIEAMINEKTTFPINIMVNLQSCSDKICLAPDEINLRVFNSF